jgi:hypothetical protein
LAKVILRCTVSETSNFNGVVQQLKVYKMIVVLAKTYAKAAVESLHPQTVGTA